MTLAVFSTLLSSNKSTNLRQFGKALLHDNENLNSTLKNPDIYLNSIMNLKKLIDYNIHLMTTN